MRILAAIYLLHGRRHGRALVFFSSRVAGAEHTEVVNPALGAEDSSFYQQKVPGLFFWLGIRPPNQTAEEAPSNHSPLFYVDESGLGLGVRAMAHLALDYLRAR